MKTRIFARVIIAVMLACVLEVILAVIEASKYGTICPTTQLLLG